MPSLTKIPTKSALRAQCRTARGHLDEHDYRLECRGILKRVTSIPEVLEARTILSYWPKLNIRELDLRPLNYWFHARGCTVLLPIIEPNSTVSRMHWGRFDTERALKPNRWGILEPQVRSDISPDGIDAVLVPGLGFDLHGYRIGYGGGYYDKMFVHVHAFKLGMVIEDCLLEMIPAQPHDIPVNCLVTARRTFQL